MLRKHFGRYVVIADAMRSKGFNKNHIRVFFSGRADGEGGAEDQYDIFRLRKNGEEKVAMLASLSVPLPSPFTLFLDGLPEITIILFV